MMSCRQAPAETISVLLGVFAGLISRRRLSPPDRIQHLFQKCVVGTEVGWHNGEPPSHCGDSVAVYLLRRQQRLAVLGIDAQFVIVSEPGILLMPMENGGVIQPGNSVSHILVALRFRLRVAHPDGSRPKENSAA